MFGADNPARGSALGHLNEVKLHRRLAAEDGHGHLELALVVIDFFHYAIETAERAVNDPDLVAAVEIELGTGLFLTGFGFPSTKECVPLHQDP